jgi:hypothetical protein
VLPETVDLTPTTKGFARILNVLCDSLITYPSSAANKKKMADIITSVLEISLYLAKHDPDALLKIKDYYKDYNP